MLSDYNKQLKNVAITGYNTEVNKSIANLSRIKLVGCVSHNLNLAVSTYLDKQEVLRDKIYILMGKLKSLKLRKNKIKIPFQPIQRNEICWFSIYDIIESCIPLRPFLGTFQGDPKTG